MAAHRDAAFAPALTWSDLRWLGERCDLPLVVKGILDPADAVRAVDAGARAIVVSNHGGRQLDGAPASATMLPEVVAAVGDRCEVLLDSGIRSGVDVLRALALGAAGVLVGRPMLWRPGPGRLRRPGERPAAAHGPGGLTGTGAATYRVHRFATCDGCPAAVLTGRS